MSKHMKDINAFISPLLRQTVGFDRMFDDLLSGYSTNASYPPFNITKISRSGEQEVYEITLAVAGFTDEDITIQVENNELCVRGTSPVLDPEEGSEVEYIHKGIAERNFQRTFRIAENVEVKGAEMKHGILTIQLNRVIPDHQKPRMIQIKS